MAAHARDVNIFIWTSRKSVDHETNDRGKVHGDDTRADGRRSAFQAHLSKMWGLKTDKAREHLAMGNQM